VTTRNPDRTDMIPLGYVGPVADLTWADTNPGGPETLTCTVQVDAFHRTPALSTGRILEVSRGGTVQYEGILQKPVINDNGSWSLTCQGAGQYGDNFRDIWSSWTVTDALNQAAARSPGPLRWKIPSLSSTGMYLIDPQDSGTLSLTEFLNTITRPGSYTWHIGRHNVISIYPIPTVPTRLLFSTSPQARSLAAFINALYTRYQVTADNADSGAVATYALSTPALNTVSIGKHQRLEQVWDITSAGVMSGATAAGWAAAAMSHYQDASFADAIPVRYGSYTTMTGEPVDLGCEHADQVVQLMIADGPVGAQAGPSNPVIFPVGKFSYSDPDHQGAVTPLQAVAASLSDFLDYLAMWLPKPAVNS
jgi:hypothetical protein